MVLFREDCVGGAEGTTAPDQFYFASVDLLYFTDVITVLFYVVVKIVRGSGAAAPPHVRLDEVDVAGWRSPQGE